MEDGRRGAFEVAREALLGRYGTLDPTRMRAHGADDVEVGAALNIARRDEGGLARDKRLILACPPTNMNELLEGVPGVPRYVPTVDHSLTRCADCGTDMWIGPRQQQTAVRAPGAFLVLCMVCAVQETERRGAVPVIGDLGGNDGRPRHAG
ncbi:hypothetical protein [Micromonospora endophytica]|uniref:Uncharacterized protein n=1 Tax=Micromonospora endophytica TaxID=515350 RepID=A0A2W2DZY9_9ACTN|nr:hypothetical protein [Micromonospora endophytica]PZF98333.1 hypothetical protein C1I93_09175 [Micromonospora endophytica]RIW43221.1 hypothetical protein D3H59_20825 [Micromonospora endophytica]BCJ61555.1 hypothetical protein Jiend_49770 [Micromonospora endophytica]